MGGGEEGEGGGAGETGEEEGLNKLEIRCIEEQMEPQFVRNKEKSASWEHKKHGRLRWPVGSIKLLL